MPSENFAFGLLLAVALVWAATLGTYLGIKRARAPLGAPEPQAIIDRRLRFRDSHLEGSQKALIATSVLLLAAVVLLILVSL